MSLPFEFVVPGPPVSQQARSRSRVRAWSGEVQRVAQGRWGASTHAEGGVMVAITYFFHGNSLDVDNIPKPMLDALKGMVYVDDTQVTDLLCRKRAIGGELRIEPASSLLLETLDRGEQFLHVAVTDARSNGVTSW
ncbi:MAG: RusA family crossover junction endodeoxyribonuclease [Gammaproteobacteria bacterium]|nr:RusA family crossover junction endodeoxyribonuclease [Gammaproteobacteria bacterium]